MESLFFNQIILPKNNLFINNLAITIDLSKSNYFGESSLFPKNNNFTNILVIITDFNKNTDINIFNLNSNIF